MGIKAPTKERIGAIDFTKGILVIFMVVYHSLNYSAYFSLGFKFFSFLPPSFIFLAGFLITNVYTRKYSVSKTQTTIRLLVRVIKLVVLFTALNLAISAVFSRNYNGRPMDIWHYLDRLFEIYVTGTERTVSFEVLLPIGYLLLFSPVFLAISSYSKKIFGLGLLLFFALAWHATWQNNSAINPILMAAGLMGMLFGTVEKSRLAEAARWWILLAAINAIYLTAAYYEPPSFLGQVLGTCTSLMLIFALGCLIGNGGWLYSRIIALGNYSLFSYIFQIALLQLTVRSFPILSSAAIGFWLLFLSTLLIMAIAVESLDYLRARLPLADRAYRLVFA